MIVVDYAPKNHVLIMHALTLALRSGKVIAFPTETSYGLAADATNLAAVKRVYKIKGRQFKKPVAIIAATTYQAGKVVRLGVMAKKIAKQFWPGPLTLVLPVVSKTAANKLLSAGTGFLGVRVSSAPIAEALTHHLQKPITATSANVSGQPDCYSAQAVIDQYKNQKIKPDIIIKVMSHSKLSPSTIVKIEKNAYSVLRAGPITEKQIAKILKK